tara:strand:- start:617 stop:1267 length:651 start_codon:yes stop_codon:yes gene_type:complete
MVNPIDIAVIDYGMGNLHSIAKALRFIAPKRKVWVGDDPDIIRSASHVIYPGVGAIRECIKEVKSRGLAQVIMEVSKSKPLLGICVGMQGMMSFSHENGGVDCLNLFPYEVNFFGTSFCNRNIDLKVPHMGWNKVRQSKNHDLWSGISNNARFYFVHSYFIPANKSSDIAGVTNYGVDIAAMIIRNNICAVQFHPEKSHNDGLQLLKNFINWDGAS